MEKQHEAITLNISLYLIRIYRIFKTEIETHFETHTFCLYSYIHICAWLYTVYTVCLSEGSAMLF